MYFCSGQPMHFCCGVDTMNDNTNLNATVDLTKHFRALIRLGQAARQLAGPAYVEPDWKEYSQRSQRDAERWRGWSEAFELAQHLWKLLVEAVGQPHAKEIMQLVVNGKKAGRPLTKDENALRQHIYLYLLVCGPKSSDAKIAKRIHENEPYYAEYQSGAIVVLNKEIKEASMAADDDPIVDRRTIKKSLEAIERDVQRFRHRAIAENQLPEEYAPKLYYHD